MALDPPETMRSPAPQIPEFRDVRQLPADAAKLGWLLVELALMGRRAMIPTDRRGGDDPSQASAVASPRDRVARQRRHGPGLAASGRAAALKRLPWAWVGSASFAEPTGEVPFRAGDPA